MTDSADGVLTAVLVHGGFLGSWIWADVVRELSRDGLRSLCMDLPSCGTREPPAGHCPQWSRPGLVASLIAGICAPLR